MSGVPLIIDGTEFTINPEFEFECESDATTSSSCRKCGNKTMPVVRSYRNTIINVVYFENEEGETDYFQEFG